MTSSAISASTGRRIRLKSEARDEYERIWSQLGGRTIEELVELPLMSDPDITRDPRCPDYARGAGLLYTDANLFSLVSCRAVNLSLEHGNSDASCLAYAVLGHGGRATLSATTDAGFRFGQLGYELVEKPGLKRFQARTYFRRLGARHPSGRDMSGQDVICCGARSKSRTIPVISLLRRYACGHLNTNFSRRAIRSMRCSAKPSVVSRLRRRCGSALLSVGSTRSSG